MRLKDITILSPQYVGDDIASEVSFVPMESLRNGTIDYKTISFAQAKGKYTYFTNQDLLIAKVTPCFENGNIAIADNLLNNVGFGSSEIFVLRPNKNVLSKYLFYLSQSRDFQGKACATMCGVGGLKRISPQFMRTYEIDMPSLEAQQRMVTYLDTKLSEIDHQVSLLTSKRDAYLRLKKSIINHAVTRGLNSNVKMKDSGIEWIGEMPEHWKPCRFKDFLKLCTITSNSINKIGLENIESGTGRFLETNTEFEGNGVEFKKGNIVYGKLRPYLQKVWIAEFSGNAVGDFFVFNTQKNTMPSYIKYLMLSDKFTKEADRSTAGAKMPRVSSNFILSLHYCLPPLQEQRLIAAYLDDKCSKIDAITVNLDKQISRYADLKRSLIDEVITGKRAV